ncbi:hypothetical protein LN652_15155 [Nocardioides okcheonensis]|nr:hypothetical protein [Nocardioides okcheonensis]UFN43375.1 hypothetical protein LN652_15155 [Nocardioides okcheonensis]
MAAGGRRQHPSHGGHVEVAPEAGPGQHPEPASSRHALAQLARPEPARGLGQSLPAHARLVLDADQPVEARPERVRVDQQGGRAVGPPLGERAGQGGAAAPADAADHPDDPARRGTLADVGHQVGEPVLLALEVDHRRGAQPDGRAEGRVARRAADDVHPLATRRRELGQVAGQVGADEHQRGVRPGREGQHRVVAGPGGDAGGGAERDDGVVDGGGGGDHEDGHDDEGRPVHRRPAAARPAGCGRRLRGGTCGCLMAGFPHGRPPTMAV